MITNEEVISIFTKMAITHPAIQHSSATPPVPNRFWGFDSNELLSTSRNGIDFNKLALGLSAPNKGDLNWSYTDGGTTTFKGKYITLVVVGKYTEGDFAGQETQAQACEQCLEDILTWLIEVANGRNQDLWPAVQLLNLNRVPVRRTNNIGIANCTGAIATIELRGSLQYDTGNPLNAMMP